MKNRSPEKWGLLSVYTGNGKGKTTAALGAAIRALGAGKKISIVYFDKGGTHYSERALLQWLGRQKLPTGGKIKYQAFGRDRIDPKTGRFDFKITPRDKTEAKHALLAAEKMFRSSELVILDEFNSCLKLGMISQQAGRRLIDKKPENVECITTGRGAPGWLRRRADLVTEMTLVKHYFYRGLTARKGIDY